MKKFLEWTGFVRELLFFLSTFGIRLIMQTEGILAVLLACICAFACIYANEKGKLRFLALLLCAGMPVLMPSVPTILIMILIIVRCMMQKWEYDYDFTVLETEIMIPVFLIFALFTGFDREFMKLGIPVFAGFLCLSMFDLRMLRSLTNTEDFSFTAMNLLLSAALGVFVAVIMIPSFGNLVLLAIGKIYAWCIVPILKILAGIVGFVVYGIVRIFLWLVSFIQKEEVEMPEMEMGEFGDYIPKEINMTSHPALMMTGTVIVCILAVIIIYFILKNIRKSSVSPNRNPAFRKEKISVYEERKYRDMNENAGIRKIYRKYLKLCQKQNIIINGSNASDVIAGQTRDIIHTDDADRLRDLWLPVRYGNKEGKDTEEAETLLRKIRKSFL